jgi:alpha-mannosidase
MGEKINAHIISHTHWDREWYLNSKYTNEWLIDFFENLFNMLEKEKEYVFVLDGQISMIDDYFEELDKKGKSVSAYREKLKKYVKEGRILVGPYYLQPDWQIVSDESLVRNMLIGIKIAEEFGKTMEVGWLLDNFGQISQTAQIHKGFGMKGLYVWRGVEMDPEDVHSEFIWESPDGSQILSVYLLDSYRNVMRLADYEDIMRKRLYDEVEKLKDFATTPNILLMNGYDQEIIPDDIFPYIRDGKMDSEKIKVFQSNPEKYIEEIKKNKPKLKLLKGPLYSGRFIAVFPGILSSRMYLKLENDRCQKLIEKYAEPLSTLCWTLGGEYEGSNLEQSWKMLLKNHPHDSICGVSIDDVHTDMEERYRTFKFMTQNQIKAKLKDIVSLIDTSKINEEGFIVFNPSHYYRSEVISIDGKGRFIKDIPPLGYKVIYDENDIKTKDLKVSESTIENQHIVVEINNDGSFNLTHKLSGKKYENLGVFEDMGDAGDEYNYSYPDIDKVITSRGKEANIDFIEKSDVRVTARVETVLEIPESLTEDRKERSKKTIMLPIVNYITVDVDSEVVKCRTIVKNTAKDHRLRVLFPTNIKTDVSFSGSAFDVVKRPIDIEEYDESSIPENVKKVIIGAREARPNTIFPQREFVDLNDGKKGLAILNKGLPEYQILPEGNTIALTLFRSVGWIATEINTRIGDAGPKIFTPDAQSLRQMEFHYGIYAHEGDVEKGKVARKADIFNSDLLIVKTDKHDGVLPDRKGFIHVKDEINSLKVTAVKRSEDGKSVIIRLYNSSERLVKGEIICDFDIDFAYYTNLKEEIMKKIDVISNNKIEIDVKPKEIITIRLDVSRQNLERDRYCTVDIIDDKAYEDLSKYESVNLITEEDIKNEEKRFLEMKDEIDNPMMRRTVLEGKLSIMLTEKKFIENEIRDLGYKLNDARVLRRVYDYIKHYKNNGN